MGVPAFGYTLWVILKMTLVNKVHMGCRSMCPPGRRRKEAGVTLLEAVAALGVMATIASSLAIYAQNIQRQNQAQRAALEMMAWSSYVDKVAMPHVRNLTLDVAGITRAAPLRAYTLPVSLPPAQGVAPRPLLPENTLTGGDSKLVGLLRNVDANGRAVDAGGRRYCLLIERVPSAREPQNPDKDDIQALVMTQGSPPVALGQVMQSIQTLGHGAGRVATAADCQGANGEPFCVTNSLGVVGNTLRYGLSANHVAAIQSGCDMALQAGGLANLRINAAAAVAQAQGAPLFRHQAIFDPMAPTPPPTVQNLVRSWNTMEHDLMVHEGDVAMGLPRVTAGTSCSISARPLARDATTGRVLECHNGSYQPPIAQTGAADVQIGGTLAAARMSMTTIGLDGPGFIPQPQLGAQCARIGDMRRDHEGAAIGCQKPVGYSVPRWERMGVQAVRWTMLQDPITIPMSAEAVSTRPDVRALFEEVMRARGQNLHYDALRMLLINLQIRSRVEVSPNAWGGTRQAYVCQDRYLPGGVQTSPNFSISLVDLVDNDVVLDTKQRCYIELTDALRDAGSREPIVNVRIMGYLCDGPDGCNPPQ